MTAEEEEGPKDRRALLHFLPDPLAVSQSPAAVGASW